MTKPWPIPDLDPDGPVIVNARAIVAVRAGELLSYDPVFHDPDAVAALHAARIAAKRLRYTIDLFAEVLGDDGAVVLAEVKALQETLGVVHDRDVLIATIERRLGQLEGAQEGLRVSLEAVLARIRIERTARHRVVALQWARLMQGDFRDRLDRLGGDLPIPTAPG